MLACAWPGRQLDAPARGGRNGRMFNSYLYCLCKLMRSALFTLPGTDHGGRAQEAGARSHGRAQEGGRLRPEPAQHTTIGRALIPVVASSGLGGRHSWRSGAPDPACRARAPAAPAAEATADSEDLAAAHHRQQRGRACLCRRPAAADYGFSGRSVSTVACPLPCDKMPCVHAHLVSISHIFSYSRFSYILSHIFTRHGASCPVV